MAVAASVLSYLWFVDISVVCGCLVSSSLLPKMARRPWRPSCHTSLDFEREPNLVFLSQISLLPEFPVFAQKLWNNSAFQFTEILAWILLVLNFFQIINDNLPVDLYLNFEKSSWKNQVRLTGFLACKNQFWNWFLQATQAVKIKFEID